MNSGFVRVVVAASLALYPCSAFEPGPRPSGAVFDPDGILNATERKDMATPLEKIFKNDGVQVMAVVMKNPDGSDPEALAASLAKAWCEKPLHAVALHIPGRDGTPWIVAGGELMDSINPDELRDELAAARRDASREPDDVSKVRTAANATADMLRYWKGMEVTRRTVIENERSHIRLELETKARRQRILMLTAAAAAIPFIVGGVLAVRLLGKNRLVPANKT